MSTLRWLRTTLPAWLLVGLSARAGAQEHAHVSKLNEPLPRDLTTDVVGYTVSPDRRWIVYSADGELDQRFELYSVPADGSAPARALGGVAATEDFIPQYRITPDSLGVVFHVDRRTGGRARLFFAPIDGSAAPRELLGGALDRGLLFFGLALSPDARRVVFSAVPEGELWSRLFTAPLMESGPILELEGPVAAGHTFAQEVSSDSKHVVFRHGSGGLYTTPLAGGPFRRLDEPFVPGSFLRSFLVAGDNVVYAAGDSAGHVELFGVPSDGSRPPWQLSSTSPNRREIEALQLDPSGERVLCRYFMLDQTRELHAVRVDGSEADVRLDLGTSMSNRERIAANGRVVFVARAPGTSAGMALFSVPLDGSAPALQLGTNPRNSTVTDFELSPDGEWVVFGRTLGTFDLFATRTDGSTMEVKLDRSPQEIQGLTSMAVGSTRVAYLASRTGSGSEELFSAPLDGGAPPIVLHPQVPPLGDVVGAIAVVGSSVIHIADYRVDGVLELMTVPIDGSAPPFSLSGPGARSTVGDVRRFELAGRHAIFLADQEADEFDELFSLDLDGRGPPRRLNRPLGPGGGVRDFLVTPDGSAVLFRTHDPRRHDLYIAPSDGRTSARKLDGALSSRNGVDSGYVLTPDGARVVYVSDERNNGIKDLFLVPLDGSAPPRSLMNFYAYLGPPKIAFAPDARRALVAVRSQLYAADLDDPSVPVATLFDFSLSAITDIAVSGDSTRAVFRGFDRIQQRYRLFSWPLDDSTGAVALMPPRTGGLDDFAVVPGTSRVIFRVALPGEEKAVRSVPVDGSAAPTPLVALGPGRSVLEYKLSPDGSRVLYRADANIDDRYELFSMPSDGSAPAVRLSYASRKDTDVSAFEFTPDSRSVLFLADTLRNEQDDLYLVPADRSSPPRRLNPSLAPHGTLFDFQCSPDGRFVAYRANHRERALVELWRVPIEGNAAPLRFNRNLVPNGDVGAFRFASADELVYTADQDEDEAIELYLGWLGERVERVDPPR